MNLQPGDRVTLHTPDNPRLHGTKATVKALTSWGAFVAAPAAATGEYRASWEEMELEAKPAAVSSGYTGDVCDQCGGVRMRRNGPCLLCENCGATTGCS